MKKLNKKGFTITELVIVISVIAILSAVLIPTFSGVIGKSKDSAAVQDAQNAYTQYLFDNAAEEDVAENFIYEYDENRCVVICDGNMVKDGDSVKLYTATEALAYLTTEMGLTETVDDKGTPDDTTDDETVTNYTATEVSDKFTAYELN